MKIKFVLATAFLLSSVLHITGQTLPLGTPVLEQKIRRDQLLGLIDSNISFTVRPLTYESIIHPDNQAKRPDYYLNKEIISSVDSGFSLQLMPIVWEHQYNSKLPYGWNDGGMIPSVGYQTMIGAGIYAKYKWFSLQLRPELVFAENKPFMGYNGDNTYAWAAWYEFANNIDMPERFGDKAYTKLLPGQSSFRVNYGPASIGISTENLWWGPGIYNSLLMTNNAPGFLHLTLNTTRPISTPIGTIEGQLIAGRLKESGFTPTLLGNPARFDEHYVPKRDDWRYISGITVSYQPKWLPGLFVGLSRSFVVYSEDLGGGLKGYLPLLGPGSNDVVRRPDELEGREDRMNRDVYASVFARWLMPKGNAEIYFEYGRTDPPWNQRDLVVELEHSRAYVLGFRKLVPLNLANEELLQVGFELTQLEKSRTTTIRTSPSWYTDSRVRHGYTHLGQVIGAGIGPGSNVQLLNVSWVKGIKNIGLQVERHVKFNDFFYRASVDYRRMWVDLAVGAIGEWGYKNMVFNGRLFYIKSHNYQYEQGDTSGDFWDFTPIDRNNFQFRLGVLYRF
ncbi:hypothetical protein JHJ32_05255 [Parapedobacter sp. ISTM3]|uniref:capsule assembly Wzi family protein n=1 Tax=Parapedobacter sp. ISTM3 TaxID=2800130 RepID=UPI001908A3A8|nr:capsule assembly Wzi family protein [Parapedobacter sp. ISTM3]MBK1439388.1 hypothetical protein [Parapedobacter sp. ISTM3]